MHVATENVGTTLLTNVLARGRRSLDGEWRSIVDPYDAGYLSILGTADPRGWFRDFKPRHPLDRVEYDFDRSPALLVPADWNTQRDDLHFYEGTVWYRRAFDSDGEAAGTRTFLHVGAANHTTRVFLDGEELALHVGGFGPFSVELTGRLDAGAHSLVLMVDNRRDERRIPAVRTDWWNFGGITRSVDLVSVPETFLRDAWLTMTPDGRLLGGSTVDGGDADLPVTVAIPSLGVEHTSTDGTFELDVDPDRWNPGRPVLHDVEFRVGDDPSNRDVVRDQIGFRTVRTDGPTILVNDQPQWLHGISIHGEGPSGGRRANGAADAETLLGWAQDLGADFVRLAHYQHDEHMVREADRRGLLAWCELPVYWGIAFDDPAVLGNALAQCDELVVRDRSRASVILWSIANETMPDDARNSFLAALAGRTRELDPTRLVTAALLTLPSAGTDHVIDDPLGEHVDVVGVNQYHGWYYGDLDTVPEQRWTNPWDKPIVFSELGAGAKAGHHGDEGELWTEEFQARFYRAQIAMVRGQAQCAGMSPWILKDFRSPMRVLPGIQDGYNRKGLVDEEGRRKLAFDVLADFYAHAENQTGTV